MVKPLIDGDWIPVGCDLTRRPQVVQMAKVLKMSRWEVSGMAIDFWSWVFRNTKTGTLHGFNLDDLRSATGLPIEFLRALVSVFWLTKRENGLFVPGAKRWLSNNAKNRLQKNLRQSRYRAKQAKEGGALVDAKAPPDRLDETRRHSMSSVSLTVVDLGKIDWEEAERLAKEQGNKAGLRKTDKSWALLLHAAALRQVTTLSLDWFTDAIAATNAKRKSKEGFRKGATDYLRGCLEKGAVEKHNADFRRLRAQIEIPEHLLTGPDGRKA